jgi:hypothetical protein
LKPKEFPSGWGGGGAGGHRRWGVGIWGIGAGSWVYGGGMVVNNRICILK